MSKQPMDDRRLEQAMQLVGVLLFVACLGFAFLVAVLVGAVGGHGASTTGGSGLHSPGATARAQSSTPSARSLVTGGGPPGKVSDMANGLPDARLAGGGDGDGVASFSASSPAPASTTVVSSVEQAEATPRAETTAQPTYAPTVIISQMTPTADNSGRGHAATPYAPTKYADNSTDSLEAQVRASVERWFPASEWATAMRVAYCESRYQPWAAEPGGAHHGVFQVADALHGTVPPDIEGQVRQAAALWAKVGWGAWSCQ